MSMVAYLPILADNHRSFLDFIIIIIAIKFNILIRVLTNPLKLLHLMNITYSA